METPICNKLSKEQLNKLKYLQVRNIKRTSTYIKLQLDEILAFYGDVFSNPTFLEEDKYFTTTDNNIPHPLCFELGHVCLFYINNFLHYVDDNIIHKTSYNNEDIKQFIYLLDDTKKNDDISIYNIFDSIKNSPGSRIHNYKYTLQFQLSFMKSLIYTIKTIINQHNENNVEYVLSAIDTYLLDVCYLHFEMHKEVIFFICNQFHIHHNCNIFTNIEVNNVDELRDTNINNATYKYIQNKWIYIDIDSSATYSYGYDKTNENELRKLNNRVIWDNECPKIYTNLKPFYVQKYPVTYAEYIKFIQEDGYKTRKYWSFNGWNWLTAQKQLAPINIKYDEETQTWYRYHFNKKVILNMSLPVVHINYYEAEAYSKYMNSDLPTESEYNYLLTNGGTTLYPWGDDNNTSLYCNSCYKNDDIVPVNNTYYDKGKNKWGISGLMGSCWYWTKTHFYPFDGFTTDPVYDTFSYPFFFDRYVVKGSSWCVNDTLFHSYYRNAQEPEKCFHFTGIRLVKHTIL
jgi:formylglycine-generating enzyme required for sulfatase activity